MKIKVKQLFIDKFDGKTEYKPGKTYDFDDERAKDLIARELGEEVKTRTRA